MKMKRIIFRIAYTITLICCMVNFISISGYCENKPSDYRFCYCYFETDNEKISGYKKLMVHNETVYLSIEDFKFLSNILEDKGVWEDYDSLPNEIKLEFSNKEKIYYFSKIGINLNWLFSVGSSKTFSLSQYNGMQSIDLGSEVISLGEEIYIPFQALFSIFNVPYNIEEDIIEVYDSIYTPSDYLHMECLNNFIYNVTPDDIISGKIGSFVDYIGDGLDIASDLSIYKIPEFIGEISGELPNEKSCEELTKMLCQVDETEKSKLLEYSDLTLNSLFPVISEISENTITEDMDVVESIKVLTKYCYDNPIINVNGNEIESKYLLNFILNTEIGDKYAQSVKNGVISKIAGNTITIGSKTLEKYIAWASVSKTSTNENIVNAVHSYCNNFIDTGELNNPTKFKNYILDYTFYDDKELVYDVQAVPLESLDKDLILNGNNAPHKRGLSNQIVTYINENSDKYIDKEKQKEYGYKLFTDGIIELSKDIGSEKITNLKILKNVSSVKNINNMKSAFGILNAEWDILKFFSNEANGTFDFYEANKMLLYANGLEQDTTNTVKAIKSHLNASTFKSQIKYQDKNENEYWDNYCDLEYVRLKSYYIAHSLLKTKNEQYVKLMNSLREQELHSYTDDVPKYVRISSEEEYNQKINFYNNLVEKENLILDELSDYMIGVLNAKQNLEKVKSTNYSKEADTKLIGICCQKVTGTVKDNNGKAIDDVIIHFKNGTDTYFIKSNTFSIYLKAGSYDVSISDDRYDKYASKISLDKFSSVSMDIVLTNFKPTPQTSAIDLIDKSIPEIISLMNGEYQIIQTEMGGYYNGTYSGIFYIQNQSVFPGMEFYVETLLNESVDFKGGQSTGKEIQSNGLRKNLEAGKYALDGIQVNKSGKVSNTIQAGMDYKSCCKVLGDFDCIPGNGGYIGGSVVSVSHTYNEKNAKVILHFFNIPSEIMHDLSFGKISSVSSEQMKSYNPKLENVVIRKAETVTTNATEPPTESPTETQTEPTSELKIETGKLSDSDIKSEWQHVISLDFEYPIFTTSDNSLKEFLDTSVTNEILSYMATDSDYNLFISGGFEYDMSIDGYLSIDGWINNHPEGGQGYLGCENYTFFVDLKNRKVLSLKDLFSESEDLVYNEIREKAHNYSDKNVVWESSLSNYDYENCKFLLNKDKLTLIFSPYEISVGAVGSVEIEIPVSDINLTCVVPEVETNGF